jgi:hypothetical protein
VLSPTSYQAAPPRVKSEDETLLGAARFVKSPLRRNFAAPRTRAESCPPQSRSLYIFAAGQYIVERNFITQSKETTIMKRAFGLVVGLALCAVTAWAQEQPPAPRPSAPPAIKTHLKVGDKAPDLKLTGVDGKVVELKKLKGKSNVVLAFYPKAFTGG